MLSAEMSKSLIKPVFVCKKPFFLIVLGFYEFEKNRGRIGGISHTYNDSVGVKYTYRAPALLK